MRRFILFLATVVFILSYGSVFAQDDEVDIVQLEFPDTLIICPNETTLISAREAAQLVVEFRETDDVLVIPFGVISEEDGLTVVTVGRLRLTCDSNVDEFNLINPSASVDINETAPQPESPLGVPETQSGYLVVNTFAANLRSCAQPTCTQVGIVNGGDFLVVLGTNGESGDSLWWYVQVGNVNGWIWGNLTFARGDLTDVPVIETEGERTAPRIYLSFTGNPIFDILSEDGVSVCEVQGGGVEYPLLGQNGDGSYVFVEANCTDGRVVQGWMDSINVIIRNRGRVPIPIVDAVGSIIE